MSELNPYDKFLDGRALDTILAATPAEIGKLILAIGDHETARYLQDALGQRANEGRERREHGSPDQPSSDRRIHRSAVEHDRNRRATHG